MSEFTLTIKSIGNKIKKFIETDYYIYAVGVIIALFSVSGLDLAALTVAVICLIIPLCFNVEQRTILPPLMMLCYSMSTKNSGIKDVSYFMQTGVLVYAGILVASLAAAFVYGFMRGRFKMKKTLNFWGFVAISTAFVVGGFFSKNYTPLSMAAGLLLALCFLGSFCLFCAVVKKKDFDYVAKIIIVSSLVVIAELLHFYIVTPVMRESFEKGILIMGWGISNAIGIMIIMGMPFAAYYMATSKKSGLFLGIMLCQLIATGFTFSRGALLAGIPLFIGSCVYAAIRNKGVGRLQILIIGGVCVIIGIAVLVVKWNYFIKVLNFYIEAGIDDRGRTELFERGFEKFLSAPAFGVGVLEGLGEIGLILALYHNTFMQFLAWGGVYGIVSYCAHLAMIVIVIIKKPNEKRTFLGVAILVVFIHSMVDCVFFFPYLTFMYTLFIALSEMDLNDDFEAQPAPETLIDIKEK